MGLKEKEKTLLRVGRRDQQKELEACQKAQALGKLVSMEMGMKHAKILLWSLFHYYIEPFAMRHQCGLL